MKRAIFGIIVLLAAISAVDAVEISAAYITDSLGARRASFSSTERITLRGEVYSASVSDRIEFTFVVYDPSGLKTLEHRGNSIPGTVGSGGSSVSDIHISKFYKTPGSYVYELRVVEKVSGSVVDTKTTRVPFFVYSPILTLTYPPNNAANLADSPLVFRWAASGAAKYRISVDDDMAFYNTLFIAETFDTFYSYPMNPSDVRQRLKGSQNYYWKVEGLDAFGNVIAASQQPFLFTIKDTASSQIARDIGITSLAISPLDEATILVRVEIKNLGARGESNINVSLFVEGVAAGTSRLDFINAGQAVWADFPAPRPKSDKFVVTAAHSFIDDAPSNNMLTLTLSMPSEIAVARGRIIGKVLEDDSGKSSSAGIADASVVYAGPVSGEVKTARNGQYQIADLPLGNYKLSVSHRDYETSEAGVEISRSRAFPNVDFRLKKNSASSAPAAMTPSAFWSELRKFLSPASSAKTEGYDAADISGVSASEFAAILESLKSGKARITNETLE